MFRGRIGWILALALTTGLTACDREPARPNIVVITLDTTRADHLGCYGYERDTSPRIDALAAESVVYERAISTSSWTLPAHASLFTGKFTTSHGAHYDPEGPLRLLDAIDGRPSWDSYRARGIAPTDRTLASSLREAGYATGAVVAGPWMKKPFGLQTGFDWYDDEQISSVAGRLATDVTDRALGWLESKRTAPFFLFLNYYDPHTPYGAPGAYLTRYLPSDTNPADLANRRPSEEEMIGLYDGEIAYMDEHLGRLFDRLKEWELYDDAWIIITADHGELLGEHGLQGHGKFLFQPELHIPFIVKYPAGMHAPRRESGYVQLVDVMPLVLHELGLELPDDIQGVVPGRGTHPIVAETYPLEAISPHGHWRALYEGDMKYAWNSAGKHLLFDLAKDPDELTNLTGPQAARAAELDASLRTYLDGLPRPDPTVAGELDEQTKEALKSLGYID